MAPCGAVLSRAVPPPRCFLLGEIEKEEKEKVWYYAQLQSLSKRLEELPHVETVSGDPWGGPGGVPPPPHLTWPCAHPPPPPAVLHADGPHPAAAAVRGAAHPSADGGALRDGR